MVNTSQLVRAVSESTGVGARTVDDVVDAVAGAIIEEVRAGRKVTIVGFGTFNPMRRAPRLGRNPRTGAAVPIPASKGVRFATGSTFKSALNPKEEAPMAVTTAARKAGAKAPARKTAARTTAGKAVTKRAPTRTTAAKKTAAKKTVATRTTAKRAVARKATTTRSVAKKTAAKKTAATKTVARKAPARATTAKKAVAKKAVARASR